MKREIKFRVWDSVLEKYMDQGDITFSDYGDTRTEVHPNELGYGNIAEYEHNVLNNRFQVEQYTGLKDCNRKEVYEGDILKVVREEVFGVVEVGFKGVVKYYEAGYWVDDNDEAISLFQELVDFKVIGNIHQNKDLLK